MKPVPVAAQRVELPSRSAAETIESHGCSVAVRRFDGPDARELFLHCRPSAQVVDPGRQAEAIYRALLGVVRAEGGSFASVTSEVIFLRDLRTGIEPVRAARQRVLAAQGGATHTPASIEIEQPPLDDRSWLEVSLQAVLPHGASLKPGRIVAAPPCSCAECARAYAVRFDFGIETRLLASGLCGPGGDAYEQAHAMFGHAENLLRRAGMEFSDVVRTWIHLRHMDRDYAALNRARREFFASCGIDPVPASTGIGGGMAGESHDLALGLYAVKADHPVRRTVMTSPTLNEAGEYGADFVRGMRVEEANKVALHVSGTASIDEQGRTAHVGAVEAQADRMLVNIAALLEGQGAGFGDVVHAITYVKDPGDAELVRARLRVAGFEGFPHAMVEARICRPDLLCETEVLAVLPKPAPIGRGDA